MIPKNTYWQEGLASSKFPPGGLDLFNEVRKTPSAARGPESDFLSNGLRGSFL